MTGTPTTRHRTIGVPPVRDFAAPDQVAALLCETTPGRRLLLTPDMRARMTRSTGTLARLAGRQPVYGLTRGFGPLAEYAADEDPETQAAGLLDHLTAGQGAYLPVDVTRTMVWLRLRGMTRGHSAVDVGVWEALAEQWNRGFVPVAPQEGSLSASGDLIPLAHAARAAAGDGMAWLTGQGRAPRPAPADRVLRELHLAPVRWDARSALAFANGTSASLARAMHNHVRLDALAAAVAAGTGRMVALLGCSTEPYDDALSAARGHAGQRRAALLVRDEPGRDRTADVPRALQEPYSIRCAPQVIGAVLDQLDAQGDLLVTEAEGCTDNPVLVGDRVLHGGNFHAAPVALASEMHALCVHQLAYLAERQLALLLDPRHNGGRPPLLTARPGRQSGFAGVQIAATAHLGAIRQRGYPASMTPVPTNLGNQDHVPLALNSANVVAEALDRAWWIVSSLFLALTQFAHLEGLTVEALPWRRLAEEWPELVTDRPLAEDVATEAARLEAHYAAPYGKRGDDYDSKECGA